MVFSLLVSAIVWNMGTWYLGLPASSSHTLIGSIMGVGLMNAIVSSGSALGGVNWAKAREVGLSLLVSPLIGFLCTAILLLLLKTLVRKPELYSAPDPTKAPPLWIRGILCLTCTGVSFAHGSNDGQKGMGLLMLILVGIVPGVYALNLSTAPQAIEELRSLSQRAATVLAGHTGGAPLAKEEATKILNAYLRADGSFSYSVFAALAVENREVASLLAGKGSVSDVPEDQRTTLRMATYLTAETIAKLNKTHKLPEGSDRSALLSYKAALDKLTMFIPAWVKVAVALALGLGTMIGWKRIVVTVGEKIGKSHLTYAQGACAELVAMLTIGLADRYGLPVSTTHVLSSGVAGAMTANRSGLQTATLRNLLLAWVLTLPVCVFLGALFFAGGLFLTSRAFAAH